MSLSLTFSDNTHVEESSVLDRLYVYVKVMVLFVMLCVL